MDLKEITEDNCVLTVRKKVTRQLDDIKESVLAVLNASIQFDPVDLENPNFGLAQGEPKPTDRYLYCYVNTADDEALEITTTLEEFAETLGEDHEDPAQAIADIEHLIKLLHERIAAIKAGD